MTETAGTSLGTDELGVLALLNGGRFGGPGVGGPGVGWGGGVQPGLNVLGTESLANGTALKESIDCNAKFAAASGQGIMQAFENNQRNFEFNRVTDGMTDLERRVNDMNAAAISTMNDFRADAAKSFCETQKAISDAAKDAAECCCAAKLQACKDHADQKALIVSENSATRELIRGDALAAANAKITQLETINALSSNGHGGHH